MYIEAADMADRIINEEDEKGLPSAARIRGKVKVLERVAQAAKTFALIQDTKASLYRIRVHVGY